ncbi:unnamed protein product [Arctia plantaginis]|uniref:Uncharacterized protein n=1 Tax=Arctia plantaginis TaxID=874455 RepID=A0A8S1A8N5_ARCPL|nr:unnamed protein product [Arctia plantaginis]
MKLLIVISCALVAVAVAAPLEPQPPQVVRYEVKQEPDGSYTFISETSDGNKREESGQLKEVLNEEGKPVKVIIVNGSYRYNDPEGNDQQITYSADQDGFHAEGPSIPKNPEVSRR